MASIGRPPVHRARISLQEVFNAVDEMFQMNGFEFMGLGCLRGLREEPRSRQAAILWLFRAISIFIRTASWITTSNLIADTFYRVEEVLYSSCPSLDPSVLFNPTRWVDTTFVPNESIKPQRSS